MATYFADFKDRAVRQVPVDRREWDKQRDLIAEFPANSIDQARVIAFKLAKVFLKQPFIDKLEAVK
jgi:hypothetical protein